MHTICMEIQHIQVELSYTKEKNIQKLDQCLTMNKNSTSGIMQQMYQEIKMDIYMHIQQKEIQYM